MAVLPVFGSVVWEGNGWRRVVEVTMLQFFLALVVLAAWLATLRGLVAHRWYLHSC